MVALVSPPSITPLSKIRPAMVVPVLVATGGLKPFSSNLQFLSMELKYINIHKYRCIDEILHFARKFIIMIGEYIFHELTSNNYRN